MIRAHRQNQSRWFSAMAVGLLALATTACGGGSETSGGAGSSGTSPSMSVPATPAGSQLAWLLRATAHPPADPEQVAAEHFDTAFLDQVSAQQLVETVAELNGPTGMHLMRITQSTPTMLIGIVKETRAELKVTLGVDDSGRISFLLFGSAIPPPASWAELRNELSTVAPDVSFTAAEVTGNDACQPEYSVLGTTPRPLASMFKLFVLGALAHQIASGRVAWSQELTVQEGLKSLGNPLGSGSLEYSPAGTNVSVQETATKMISLSDNTAADMLINLVGRSAVEAQTEQWSSHAGKDDPFLTTRELFLLHYLDFPALSNQYLRVAPSERGAFLASSVDPLSLSQVQESTEPRDVDTIEWFASADDMCRALAGLSSLATQPGLSPIGTALSANTGGIDLNSKSWPTVLFKGGSEPGVLTLGYLARDSQGRTFVVVALAENPNTVLDGASVLVLNTLIHGAFNLLG